MRERVNVVDTNVLSALLTNDGAAALDVIFSSGRRILMMSKMVFELTEGAVANKRLIFNSWLD